jgi:murein tripeptide amidase MpaA
MTRPLCTIDGCRAPQAHDNIPFCSDHWGYLPPGLQDGIREAARLKLPMSKATYTARGRDHINACISAARDRLL